MSKRLARLAALGLCLGLLAGCGDDSGSGSGTPAGAGRPAPSDARPAAPPAQGPPATAPARTPDGHLDSGDPSALPFRRAGVRASLSQVGGTWMVVLTGPLEGGTPPTWRLLLLVPDTGEGTFSLTRPESLDHVRGSPTPDHAWLQISRIHGVAVTKPRFCAAAGTVVVRDRKSTPRPDSMFKDVSFTLDLDAQLRPVDRDGPTPRLGPSTIHLTGSVRTATR